jgi:hypothetical protein
MRRFACLLTLAGSMIWLTAVGVIEPSAPAFARQVKERAVGKKMAVPPVAVDQADILIQQYGPVFKQLHKRELHFMRMICQPTKEQFARIEADTEPALKETIKKIVPLIQRPSAEDDHPDPRKPIAQAIAKSVRTVLSPELESRYQKEIDQRDAANKQVVVLGFVVLADKILALTPDQRVKFGKILNEKWKEASNRKQYLASNGQYFPQMPEEINGILTEPQKVVWAGVQKTRIHFGFNFGNMLGIGLDEEPWDEAEPPAERERAGERAPAKADENAKKAKKK